MLDWARSCIGEMGTEFNSMTNPSTHKFWCESKEFNFRSHPRRNVPPAKHKLTLDALEEGNDTLWVEGTPMMQPQFENTRQGYVKVLDRKEDDVVLPSKTGHLF